MKGNETGRAEGGSGGFLQLAIDASGPLGQGGAVAGATAGQQVGQGGGKAGRQGGLRGVGGLLLGQQPAQGPCRLAQIHGLVFAAGVGTSVGPAEEADAVVPGMDQPVVRTELAMAPARLMDVGQDVQGPPPQPDAMARVDASGVVSKHLIQAAPVTRRVPKHKDFPGGGAGSSSSPQAMGSGSSGR